MKSFYSTVRWGIALLLIAGCATNRKPSSLDNNGEPVDDSLDPVLETYYGGSQVNELKAINAVADVIRQAVAGQQQKRHEVLNSSDRDSDEAQRIFKDLPKPDYATRDVHRKTNGCFKAELNVAPELAQNVVGSKDPADLGVFAPGASYDAIVRFSNGNPAYHPDRDPDARGFAVKILPKGTLAASPLVTQDATSLNAATKLDILSINFPTFFVSDPVKYVALNRGALDAARDFKNGIVSQIETFKAVFLSSHFTSLERGLALRANGSVIYSPLYQQYYSMVPSRLGPQGQMRAVKYSWTPVACSAQVAAKFKSESNTQWAPWTQSHNYLVPALESLQYPDNYLRQHVTERLAQDKFCFDLYFQFYQDPKSTNIEDSTDIWLSSEAERAWWKNEITPNQIEWLTSLDNTESRSDYISRIDQKKIAPKVLAAHLEISNLPADEAAQPASNNKTCEDLSFNPWNGDIAHHKPLGIVSRMKRKVYNASRRERHELNGINDKSIERQ
ncbi:MAG: hypothetical protein ACXWQQ_12240 [Pseudobdellovibrio sp.]